ncbi:uncharacterized protein VTP21DRAFT_10828 [Calcarisporiella thermophila]|uniref:uncharacterized protein n=1 Tax=Calcarisporiella thermophila TaxID=911321 RepID=UPI003742E903
MPNTQATAQAASHERDDDISQEGASYENLSPQVLAKIFELLQGKANRTTSPEAAKPPTDIHIEKPEKFSGGESKPASMWLSGVELYLELAEIPKGRWTATTGSLLMGEAYDWFVRLCTQKPHFKDRCLDTFAEFSNEFLEIFEPMEKEFDLLLKYEDTRQVSSVRNYVQGLNKLWARFPWIPEQMYMTKFVGGLKAETRRFVLDQFPKNLEEAISTAIRYDEAKFGKNGRLKIRYPNKDSKEQKNTASDGRSSSRYRQGQAQKPPVSQ